MRDTAIIASSFLLASGFLTACVTTSTVEKRAKKVEELATKEHDPMENCTPVELARAEAYAAFARNESSHGRPHTALAFLRMAEAEVQKAYKGSRSRSCLGDEDGDGIPDKEDLCPKEPEDKDHFKDQDGCPEADNDLDGINDKADKCPNDPGPVANNGCPFLDSDGDGLADDQDLCPKEFGPKKNKGCPIKDQDKDGTPDSEDKCISIPGPKENHGCPYKYVEITDKMLVLKQKIFFAFGKAKIRKRSYPLLNEIVQVLRDHPTYVIRIEGHTDNVGSRAFNMKLSRARAEAVRRYLVGKGIEPSRLKAVGYGPDRPIDDNSTPEGRAVNRRVEFHIISK